MSNTTLSIRTDRPDARYRRGELIAFIPTLTGQGEPVRRGTLDYKVFYDTDTPVKTGTLDLASDRPAVTASLDTPGFVQCEVAWLQDAAKPVTAAIGAAVEPEAIVPDAPRPDDFDDFWRTQLAELAKIPMEARQQPVACDFLDLNDIRINSLGAPVSGYFAKPREWPEKLPALIQFQGAGVKSAFPDVPALWASRGFLALCINAHGLPNGQSPEFYADLAIGGLAGYQHRGLESRETYYMLGVFQRVKRAIDFITAQPEWDGRHLFMMGHSQGAYQAIAGAYLDQRVSALAAGVPAGCALSGAANGRCEGWPKVSVAHNAPGRDGQKIEAAVPYFDNANFLQGVKCPAIFSVGWIDISCRPTAVYAAINKFAGKKIVLDRPSMPHGAPRDVRAEFDAFLTAQYTR